VLAEHFLRRFSAKYGKEVRSISPAARELLLAYPWPGNIRELSHVIERAVLWSRDTLIDVDHLSLTTPLRPEADTHQAGTPTAPLASLADGSPAGDLSGWERTLIERAMREAGGNQTKAAQRLGITRDTLRYRLKKFGIQGG
jgi:two-component system response regulator HydG